MVPHKLQPISYVINHVSTSVNGDNSPFEMLSEAPIWLRLLARGGYCAYGNTIYVPSFHLELVSSQYDADKTLATAKLLPWIMLLHDEKSVSFRALCKALFSLDYQLHYFLYEFLFLKATKHRFFDVISLGFMTTRRTWYKKKLTYEDCESRMQAILDANKP